MNEVANVKQRFAAAIERLDGDFDLLCQMAAITAPDCPSVVADAQSDIDEGNCENASRSLHKLKGMLSTFDSDGVVLEIQEMLQLARRERLAELSIALDQNRRAIDDLIMEIRELSSYSS